MCGGLVVATCKSTKQYLAYHLYRLLGYVCLGFLAGLFGQSLKGILASAYLIFGLKIAMGVSMVLMGLFLLLKPYHSLHIPFANGVVNKLFKVAELFEKDSVSYAGLVGFATAFLPCGWLYLYLITALSTGTIIKSVTVMAIFWLGTIPALTIFPKLIQKSFLLTKRFAAFLPGLLMVIVGIYSLISR